MARMLISPQVRYRSESGRFLANCDQAGTAAVTEAVEEGAKLARVLAPVGAPDKRDELKLRAGIEGVLTGPMDGHVISRARVSKIVEEGSAAHSIGAPGQTLYNPYKFFGPRSGPVSHPGTTANPFMRPSFAALRGKLAGIMRKHYP